MPITAEQASVADLDDTKLRLGFINSNGEQKGVDSLIVTDLIELSRQRAICDAILLSGDEDVRVGVQIAQNYGVRVHLLGIEPARSSQARTLMQEADTTFVWDRQTVAKFLAKRLSSSVVLEGTSQTLVASGSPAHPVELNELTLIAADYADSLSASDIESIQVFWKTERGIPREFDAVLLRRCRPHLHRELDDAERKAVRAAFQKRVQSRSE